MAERKGIVALAVHFTAGVAAGTLLLRLPASPYLLSTGLLLVLASLVVVILKTARHEVLFPAFLALGAFCALADAFPGPDAETLLERWASALGARTRIFIDGIPFPSEGTAPLVKALLTGDRSGLPRETVQVFRTSGGAHLLALSGLHVGILYLFLSKLLWPIGNSPIARCVRYVLTVLLAGLFTLMTGATPSLVRAFLFIVVNETSRLVNRPRDGLQVLSAALLVQLVLAPSAISSLGFQLSYLAMAGIFLLYPVLEAWYPKGPRIDPVRRIWQAAALAMPLTTLLMGSAVTTILLQGLGLCPGFLLQLTDALCSALVWILRIIASM